MPEQAKGDTMNAPQLPAASVAEMVRLSDKFPGRASYAVLSPCGRVETFANFQSVRNVRSCVSEGALLFFLTRKTNKLRTVA